MEVKENDYIYVYKTEYTLQIKNNDFMANCYKNSESVRGKFTSLDMANYAIKNNLAKKI